MAKGLQLAAPPKRRTEQAPEKPITTAKPKGEKFTQTRPTDTVQFNKKVRQDVADGYEILAVKTRVKIPELLAEGLALLEAKYGKS